MNTLGIYFGPQAVRIVETKGRQPVNNIRIPLKIISSQGASQEKVPEEVKLITLIKGELEKNKIQPREIVAGISGKDLIIRIFEMPIMPQQELVNAVNFEAKKYIPFRIEELITDFQFKLDRANRKNYVLFMGIKKEVLDKYLSILKQAGLKVSAIEYSGFSVLRLFALANLGNKDVRALVNIDLKEGDEVNFMVLESGFPLFSRDIPFVSEPRGLINASGVQAYPSLERLKSEIRMSLTYYDRTFPNKNISKMFFLMDTDYRADLEGFMKEIGLNTQFINFNKCINGQAPYSLEFIKAYCSSLPKVKTAVKIDLLSAKEKTIKTASREALAPLPANKFKPQLAIGAISLFILASVFLSGVLRISPLQSELKGMIDKRPTVSGVSQQASLEELTLIDSDYKAKLKAMDTLVRKQMLLTELLEETARILPKNTQLTEMNLEKAADKIELSLEGIAYLGESSRELEAVNAFLPQLKGNTFFSRYFTDISIVSIDRGQSGNRTVTKFKIFCKNYK